MPQHSAIDSDSDVEDTTPSIPLEHVRPFGSGLHRKPITFVRAGSNSSTTFPSHRTTNTTAPARKSAAEQYLAIVSSSSSLPPTEISSIGASSSTTSAPIQNTQLSETQEENGQGKVEELCGICNLPLSLTSTGTNTSSTTTPSHAHLHESLLAHQLSLPHIHPPSALDRQRMGLRYLVSQGWDPDSREGLGKSGEGMRAPIKVVEKRDTLGLGVELPKRSSAGKVQGVKKKIGAKEARNLAVQERKRRDELQRRMFGREEEIERVLRGG